MNNGIDLSGWPTKAEAAAQLDTSARTIERMISDGRIEGKRRRNANGTRETVCNPRDIENLQPATHLMPETSAVTPIARNEIIGRPDPLELMAAALAALAGQQQPIREEPRAWLTVKEAADYNGLSEALLRRAIRTGKLAAVKDRRWKINRAALDQFDPALR